MNHSQPAPPIPMSRARRGARGPKRLSTATVAVSWTPAQRAGAPTLVPSAIELTRELGEANRAWTCLDDDGFNWVEALAAARCSEVVLTARLGDDAAAKHLVLELAELLTFRLADAQPLIRVLFLPTLDARRSVHNHA